MEKTKILFISQEITPYLPESEMSVTGRYLPQGIQERGCEIRAFMPRFGTVNERRNQLHEVIRLSGMNLIIDSTDHPLIIKVASIQSARMQVYFIDNDDVFGERDVFADSDGQPYPDNDERAIFFSRGVIETVKKLRWIPDVVHCIGWMSFPVPLMIKKAYKDDPLFCNSKVVYSIYNDFPAGVFGKSLKKKFRMDGIRDKHLVLLENPDYIGTSKLAIEFSDAVIFGSPQVDENLRTFAQASGKPVLEYQPQETYIDAYLDLYKRILNI